MKPFKFTSIIIVFLFSLAACGEPFHLRGNSGSMPKPEQVMSIQGINLQSSFGQILQENLRNAHVTIQANAPTLLTIVNLREDHTVSAYSATRQVREFNYTLDVTFRVSGKSIRQIENQTVHVERPLIYDSNYVLGTASEADRIMEELRREAVRLMILRLRAASNAI